VNANFFLLSVILFCAVTVACGNENESELVSKKETTTSNTNKTIVVAETTQTNESESIAAADDSEDEYADIRDKLQTCAACHGEKGVSVIPTNPILAGQEFYYMYVQLKDIKSGLRESAIMAPLVADLEKEEMKKIAEYYSKQVWPETTFKTEQADISAGKKVVTAGQCVACHLGSFKGNSRIPRMAGQHVEYLTKTMLDFKNKVRKNSAAKGSLMASFSDADIHAVAKYLAGYTGQ